MTIRFYSQEPSGDSGCRTVYTGPPCASANTVYYSADGACNNGEGAVSPLDGAAGTPFKRAVANAYADGDSEPAGGFVDKYGKPRVGQRQYFLFVFLAANFSLSKGKLLRRGKYNSCRAEI